MFLIRYYLLSFVHRELEIYIRSVIKRKTDWISDAMDVISGSHDNNRIWHHKLLLRKSYSYHSIVNQETHKLSNVEHNDDDDDDDDDGNNITTKIMTTTTMMMMMIIMMINTFKSLYDEKLEACALTTVFCG